MKKAKLLLSVGMFAIAGVTLVSCGGSSECPIGYEGSDCKTLSRDKFIGNWDGKDVCESGTYELELTVGAATNEIQALVKNPGGFGGTISITGEVTDPSTLKFTNQDVGSDRILNGKMTINGSNSSITFDYDVTDAFGDSDDCVGTYSRL